MCELRICIVPYIPGPVSVLHRHYDAFTSCPLSRRDPKRLSRFQVQGSSRRSTLRIQRFSVNCVSPPILDWLSY